MAGSEIIYNCTFDDYNGNVCQVHIGQPGYSGSTTEVEGGPAPALVRMMSEGDSKFVHIKPTEAVIELVSSTSLQYLSLFTAKNKTYYIRIYRGSALIYQGWINPEYYTEPLSPPPYITTITSTDGLAELKNVPFPIPSYTVFKHSVISYIATCLSQIGSIQNGIQIRVSKDFTGTTTADGWVVDRVLEKFFIDYRSMRDGEELWNCWDVLNEILAMMNARLFFYADYWHIERIDKKYTDHDYDVYDINGTYVSTVTGFDAIVELTASTDLGSCIRFVHSPAMVEVQPAYKGYAVDHEWGHRLSILKASNFDGKFYDQDFVSDTQLRYWDADSGTETALVEKVTVNDENYLLMKPIPYALGQVPSFTAYIEPIETGSPASRFVWTYDEGATNEPEFMNWQYGLGVCKLKYKVFANWTVYETAAPNLTSFVNVFINCSGTIYQLWSVNNGDNSYYNYEWVETVSGTPTTYEESHIKVIPPKGEWSEVDLQLVMPPQEVGNTQTYVGFLIQISSPNLNAATMSTGDGLLYKDITLSFMTGTLNDVIDNNGIKRYAEKQLKLKLRESRVVGLKQAEEVTYSQLYETTIDADNLLEPEVYEFKYGESPAPYAADGHGLVNRYVVFDSDGNPVNLFGDLYDHTRRLVNMIGDELEVTYRQPLFKLRGTIIDTTLNTSTVEGSLDFRTILKDYDSRYYFQTGQEYDLKACTFTGEWVQMHDDSGTGGEFNDDFNEDFWI